MDKVKIIDVNGKTELIQTENETFKLDRLGSIRLGEAREADELTRSKAIPWRVLFDLYGYAWQANPMSIIVYCDDEAEARAIHQQVTDIWAAHKED